MKMQKRKYIFFDRNTKRNIDDSLVLKHFIFSINHYSAGGLTKPECWKQIGEYLLEERGPRCLFFNIFY